MIVFHYTHFDNWEGVKNGSWESKNIPGLGANRRVGRADQEACNTTAVFALQEPLPDTWTHNADFIDIWDFFKRQVGRILLEIDINPDRDPVYILDRGHIEGFLYEQKGGIPKRYLHDSRIKSERAYMASKIPLKKYQENNDHGYSLPEVIITQHVPLDKIKVSTQQPFLDADLTTYCGRGRQKLMNTIEGIPGLETWYKKEN